VYKCKREISLSLSLLLILFTFFLLSLSLYLHVCRDIHEYTRGRMSCAIHVINIAAAAAAPLYLCTRYSMTLSVTKPIAQQWLSYRGNRGEGYHNFRASVFLPSVLPSNMHITHV